MAEMSEMSDPVMLTLYTHTGQAVQYPKPKGKATFNESKGDGVSWAGYTWGPVTGCKHGCPYCLAPDTPVLMADMTWKPIGQIRVGDQMVAFDEHHHGGKGGGCRRSGSTRSMPPNAPTRSGSTST